MLVTSGEIFYGDARTDETNIPRLVINYDRFSEREREGKREKRDTKKKKKACGDLRPRDGIKIATVLPPPATTITVH